MGLSDWFSRQPKRLVSQRAFEKNHEKIQIITGWTAEILMTEDSVLDWTKEMCALGFACDCDFDGWGTSRTKLRSVEVISPPEVVE